MTTLSTVVGPLFRAQRCLILERKKIYQIVKSIVPETAIDFTRILPRIVSTYIFSFLDPRSLCRAAQVSCYWRILCESNSIWAPKCLLLGWQLPNVLAQPESGAYKQLYIENMLNLRLDSSPQFKSELKKIRKRLALDEQRAAENKKKQLKGQKTPLERSQVHWCPQHRQTSNTPRNARSSRQFSAVSKSFEELPSTKLSNESHMSSKKPFNRTLVRQTNYRARVAAVTERPLAPLERQRNSATCHPPILDIIRNVECLHQQKSKKTQPKAPTAIVIAPYDQEFVQLSPKAIKALPPPPPYKFGKIEEQQEKTYNRGKENAIFDLIKDVPT
ncbi:Cyclin F box donain containing protein [Echinococcus multilocularis]|uniref:Cyclin F box donain containing protein n=1 Tax=Echinococcus multilocularis TaxID=6211 RepID=A0A087W128_ECHMU|nr:Cyclin F box donain containing protein [Echinococcus multilocularis]